ncbi:MAG: octanoyltransferase [Chthoniobacterales bacterium]|nr:MAG: octanoyltransferase [Chthoniobacterales bacterium]
MKDGAAADFTVQWLGRLEYAGALALQEQIVAEKRSGVIAADTLLLLEHDPVYTIGRTPDQRSLRGAMHLPHPLFQTNRGGQATYHGPGQLIGYPVIDLRNCGQDLHKFLRWIEELLLSFLTRYNIDARRRDGLTGVWVEDRKIASIGVGVRHWITMHGFALNVCGDLSPFAQITPCGIANVSMTSIEKECGESVTVADAAGIMSELAARAIGDLRSLAVMRA